ncbi:hypothetical protein [Phormidesmis priestleyi]|uniref:hypothetical protein n=1 Tax=Phormidesmis priestleyi TaxID=268141 RepID=UPI00083B337E|nr:hypothetical protein [Phormidesmis priestleyi]
MNSNEFKSWAAQVTEVLVELASQHSDYPLGTNELRKATSNHTDLPQKLQPLYEVCDGMSLPDVHNGYFIDPAQRVTSASKRGEPILVEGSQSIPILVFGSDGGGGRFVLGTVDGAVYYLPSSGAVKNSTYIEDSVVTARRVAGGVIEFLWRLKDDINAFVYGHEDHVYLTNEIPERS